MSDVPHENDPPRYEMPPLPDDGEGSSDRGPRRRRRPQPVGADPSLKYVVPLNVSVWALVAGYLGLVSVLLIPAPFALLCGLMGVRDIRRNPTKDGMGRCVFGIVMGLLFSLLMLACLVPAAISALTGGR